MKLLYHYTTMESLLNGIIVKELEKNKDKEICLHGTKFNYLNDPTENILGQKLAFDAINKYYKEAGGYLWGLNFPNIEELKDVICHPYIVSFSKNRDTLPMWGLYGKNGGGIALGFNLKKTTYNLKECKYYNPSRIDQEIELGLKEMAEMKGYKDNPILGYTNFISELCIRMKDKSYAFEKEYRIFKLADTKINECSIYKQELIDCEEKYKISRGIIIPYKEFFLSKENLKEIIIGPVCDFINTKEALDSFLKSKGLTDIKIIQSEVPYRN